MSAIQTNPRLSLVFSISFLCSFTQIRCLNFIKKQEKMADLFHPPPVRGMKKLDRKQFVKVVDIPCLKVNSESVNSIIRPIKKYLLKLPNFKSIRSTEDAECVSDACKEVSKEDRKVYLNPKIITSFSDISEEDRELLNKIGIDESNLSTCPLQLNYENWSADDILKAVLPEDKDSASSYSLIGHIVHLNLREHLNDYRYLIGEVLLDKIKRAETVVNKVDTIDTTFRVFNMEVLAGKPEFVTEVKENNMRFKFDFSSVYWNPRLSTEHERIIKKLEPGNVLYDVFAGVGPFSIPAAKKKCIVMANDLNPESFKWLNYNAELNKVGPPVMTTHNKDGADFIKEDVKEDILKSKGKSKSHVVMNLPSLATTFLHAFKQLFTPDQLKEIKTLPLAHVYCFVKGEVDTKKGAQEMVESELNCSIAEALDEVTFVRKVAPNKDMIRVSFQLTDNIILSGKRKLDVEFNEQELKRMK